MKLDSVRGLSSARARPRPRLQHDMPYRWSVVEMRQVRLVWLVWQVRQGRIVPVEWHKFLLPFNVVGRVDMEKINVMWQTSSFYPIKITQPDHDDTWWEYVRDVTRHETIMHNNYIMELLPSGREREWYWEWYVYKPINHCRNFHLLDRLSIRKRIELSAETNGPQTVTANIQHQGEGRWGREASGQWVGSQMRRYQSDVAWERPSTRSHTHVHTH